MIGISHRLRSRQRQEPEESSLDLTSLMDTVFILLIFFVLTSGMTQVATQVDLSHSTENSETQTKSNAILVEIFDNPRQWKVDGVVLADYLAVTQHLLKLHQEDVQRDIVLAPARQLPVEELIQLLNFLAANRITNAQIISQWAP